MTEVESKNLASEIASELDTERQRVALERERTEFTAKLAASEKRADEAEGRLRRRVITSELGDALDRAGVLPVARAKVAKLMAEECEVDLDDEGNVASVTYNGRTYGAAADAAAAYLSANEFFAGAAPAGTRRAPEFKATETRDLSGRSAANLLSMGLAMHRKQKGR